MTQSICLNMIVKDESHIIEKTLENLCSYINFTYWVICDTGSTDNTKDLITEFFKEKHIPGELLDHEWKDFGYNRTKALECAYFKTDYVLIFDADDSIHRDFKVPDILDVDMYCLKIGEGFTYMRPLLVSNKKKWKFVGVLHEFLVSCEDTCGEKIIEGDYYIDSGKSGSRSQDPDKYLNDARILEKGYHDEYNKDNGLACRYAFYCAQSYKDYGNNDKSIKWYKKVLDLNNWAQEKYYTCITLGGLYKAKNDNENAVKYWLKSIEYDKERIEGVVSACEHYRYVGLNFLVYLLYEKFKNYNKKPQDKLFLSCSKYNDELEYQNSVCAYYIGEHESGYECCKKILIHSVLDYSNTKQTSLNLNFYRKQLEDDEDTLTLFYMYDNLLSAIDLKNETVENTHYELWNILFEKNKYLLTKYKNYSFVNKETPVVFLSFTTCKRLDLFQQTVNSILNHWTDIGKIDYWFCVDDNSSEEDRNEMRDKYDWIDYYMKKESEKGHRESMNIIWNKLNELKPKYWIHMEDDFLFHKEMDYVTAGINGLERFKENRVKQVLFNRGYGETLEDYKIKSFVPSEEFIVLHDHKNGDFSYPNCHYWPHYSLRPSIIDVETILDLGNYDSDNQFFEMDYANKWCNQGCKSAFFNTITNRHIGRLTSERNNNDKTNAYTLNSEEQFVKKSPFIKIINLKRREDRKKSTIDKLMDSGIVDYEFTEAVDGESLAPTEELTTLFEGNDFGDRKGVIGCALSHYNLWKQLVDDTSHEFYVIMEDDFTLCENFKKRFESLQNDFLEKEVLFFGYSMFEKEREKVRTLYDNCHCEIKIENLNKDLYVGGTFGYSINKTGAKNLLNFISQNGIKHGIDYVMGKLNYEFAYETQPQLFFSEWNEAGKDIDSNIQNNYENIDLSSSVDRINEEFIFIPHIDQIENDIYYHMKSVAECMEIALNDDKCVGFNTLGFFKDNIDNLTTSQYFGEKDGIYIKKIYYNCTNEEMPLKNIAFITLTNSGYLEYTKNCLTSLQRCNSLIALNCYCIDENSYKSVQSLSKGTYLIGNINNRISEFITNDCNNKQWMNIVENKFRIIHDNLLRYQYVLFTDGDIVFEDNRFLEYCYKYIGENDLIAQNDEALENYSSICSGFMFIKSNDTTKRIFNIENINSAYKCDQIYINEIKDEFTYKLLPRNLFPNGAYYYSNHPPNPYIIHFNCISGHEKKKKMQQNNKWFIIRIKMLCDWESSKELCEEFNNMLQNKDYIWNNIEITWEDENIDYYVIINKPLDNEYYNPEKTIIFQMEPWVYDLSKNWGVKTWGEWSVPNKSKFMHIHRHIKYLNNVCWHFHVDYNTIINKSIDKIAFLPGPKNFDEGHIKRITFGRYIEENSENVIDIYGEKNFHNFKNYVSGFDTEYYGVNCVLEYKYNFMCENNSEYNYATEKIWEPILCECLCFYWGCPNLEDYIDNQAFVRLDLDNFEGSLKIIKQAIEEDWWSQRINIIRKEKQKILTELGFFPTLERIITN